jgi:sugar O-acyltransferase (sialic acid O-acetyltransferase NeuD family)
MKKIVILGGGGHARVLIDLIKMSTQYEIVGILDPQLNSGINISGIPVMGNDDLLYDLCNKKGIRDVCIGVGSTKDNTKRRLLYQHVKQLGLSIPCLIHIKATVSVESKISEGVQVMAGAIIQTGSLIGENAIINTSAIIEHDCEIGKHVHICSGAVISGGVIIGDSAFIGAGATIIQGIKIGSNSVVAAGAVVVNDVGDGLKVKGVPAE